MSPIKTVLESYRKEIEYESGIDKRHSASI